VPKLAQDAHAEHAARKSPSVASAGPHGRGGKAACRKRHPGGSARTPITCCPWQARSRERRAHDGSLCALSESDKMPT
jgi:hypothetical protein